MNSKLTTNFAYPGKKPPKKRENYLVFHQASSVCPAVSLSKVHEIYSIVNTVVYTFDNRLTKRHYRCLKFKILAW